MTGLLTPPIKLFYPHERLFIQAAYCSFCKNLSKKRLWINRIFLNYDALFFYVLFLLSFENYKFTISPFFCKTTFTNRFLIEDNGLIEYFTDYSSIFSSLKFFDNYKDEKAIKSLYSYLLFKNISKSIKYIKSKSNIEKNLFEEYFENPKKENFENSNEIENLIKFFEEIFPFDYMNYMYRKSISIILSNLIKLIFFIDAIDDFEDDFKNHKNNIFVTSSFNNRLKDRISLYKNINFFKLKNNQDLLDKIKSECFFSLNYSLNELSNLPNKNFAHIIQVYFTDLLPMLLDKSLIKNGCDPIFYQTKSYN